MLLDLNIEKVTDYFVSNWHNISDEWTQFGKNKFANYLNYTNNRTDKQSEVQVNQQSMCEFGDVFRQHHFNSHATCIREKHSLSSDDHACIKKTVRRRISWKVTHFKEYYLNDKRNFTFVTAAMKKMSGKGHTVTSDSCTCGFFASMEIPCPPIFRFLLEKS